MKAKPMNEMCTVHHGVLYAEALTQYGITPVRAVLPDEIVCERIHPDAQLPKYASDGDSGADVYATEDMLIRPGETKLAKLGLLVEIPVHPFHDYGLRWELQARPRSGVSLKTMLRLSNAPGTIDNFYRNELGVILTNTANTEYTYGQQYGYDSEKELYARTSTQVHFLDGTNFCLKGLSDAELRGLDFDNPALWEPKVPNGTIFVRKGDRIAQLVFNEVARPRKGSFTEGNVNTDISRGGGFGSTGTRD